MEEKGRLDLTQRRDDGNIMTCNKREERKSNIIGKAQRGPFTG